MKEKDMINNPPHYMKNGKDTWNKYPDLLKACEYKGFLKGNIIKYLVRCEEKNGVEDLKKGRFYLNKLIEKLEEEDVRWIWIISN